jgi:hypothetical protein
MSSSNSQLKDWKRLRGFRGPDDRFAATINPDATISYSSQYPYPEAHFVQEKVLEYITLCESLATFSKAQILDGQSTIAQAKATMSEGLLAYVQRVNKEAPIANQTTNSMTCGQKGQPFNVKLSLYTSPGGRDIKDWVQIKDKDGWTDYSDAVQSALRDWTNKRGPEITRQATFHAPSLHTVDTGLSGLEWSECPGLCS